jgi:L-alanine-DL-glutamate epimerase-like enolase superfamily enzyme
VETAFPEESPFPLSEEIRALDSRAYRFPTDFPESDGTYRWESTTLVLVEIRAGGRTGIGYTYGAPECASLARTVLFESIRGRNAFDVPGCFESMGRAVRNLGREGIAAMAISAVDLALWDLKAKLLGVPLRTLLGGARDSVPLYGSGGFTSYDERRLRDQLGKWAELGFPAVKMKVGTEPDRDPNRVQVAREAVGAGVGLFVDANGAYSAKEAVDLGAEFADSGVSWFEEPVSSDDLDGLRLVRERAPPALEIAAGEYGFDSGYFRRMIESGAVDVLQADATRCGGITGFLRALALAEAHHLDLSAHCAPTAHSALGCVSSRIRHLEYFHDHARIESRYFDGAPAPRNGRLRGSDEPGLGIRFKGKDAEPFLERS